MVRYSTEEQVVKLQASLYAFDQEYGSNIDVLAMVGDILPGVILVNDMRTLGNAYMNKTGLNYLHKSAEELRSMGLEYFASEMFCPDEMQWVTRHFGSLIQRNDVAEVTGFYQKVRPDRRSDWDHFYLTGKLLGHDSNFCVYLGMAAPASNYELHQIGKKLEVESASPVEFQRFNSLTKREKQVLGLIAQGLSNKKIAELLYVAPFTIETHRKHINQKLGTKNIRDLIAVASRFGL